MEKYLVNMLLSQLIIRKSPPSKMLKVEYSNIMRKSRLIYNLKQKLILSKTLLKNKKNKKKAVWWAA